MTVAVLAVVLAWSAVLVGLKQLAAVAAPLPSLRTSHPPNGAAFSGFTGAGARPDTPAVSLATPAGSEELVRLGYLLRQRGQAARAMTLTLSFGGDSRWDKTGRLAEASAHEEDLHLLACQMMARLRHVALPGSGGIRRPDRGRPDHP
ncbi:hypothetical protein [Streptomyces humi]